MTVTARSSVVGMPPGRYQIATVLKGKINTGGVLRLDRPKTKPYRRRRPEYRTWKDHMVRRILWDAAINDPDDRQELWIR